MEKWKDIPGWEGLYQAGSSGQIKSLSRTVMGRNQVCEFPIKVPEKILKPSRADGYLQVMFSRNGKLKTYKVHILIAMVFHGYVPNGKHDVVVNHIDEDKENCAENNLEIIPQQENAAKYYKNRSEEGKCSSKYTGVSWNKSLSKWEVKIHIGKGSKTTSLGLFIDEEEAALMHPKALRKYNDNKEYYNTHIYSLKGTERRKYLLN